MDKSPFETFLWIPQCVWNGSFWDKSPSETFLWTTPVGMKWVLLRQKSFWDFFMNYPGGYEMDPFEILNGLLEDPTQADIILEKNLYLYRNICETKWWMNSEQKVLFRSWKDLPWNWGLNKYEPVNVSHERLYQKSAQSRSSNLAQFNIYCKGKCFMSNGASRFKKYWTLNGLGHSHEKFQKWPFPKAGVQMRLYLVKGSSGETEIFCTYTT